MRFQQNLKMYLGTFIEPQLILKILDILMKLLHKRHNYIKTLIN